LLRVIVSFPVCSATFISVYFALINFTKILYIFELRYKPFYAHSLLLRWVILVFCKFLFNLEGLSLITDLTSLQAGRPQLEQNHSPHGSYVKSLPPHSIQVKLNLTFLLISLSSCIKNTSIFIKTPLI